MDQNTSVAGLPYVVVRITAGDRSDPTVVHFGTGFFFRFRVGELNADFIVSNRHVIERRTWLQFDFGTQDAGGYRILGPAKRVRIGPGSVLVIAHPNPEIDLAMVSLGQIVKTLDETSNPHFLLLNEDSLPDEELQSELHAATPVLMVGFPNGLIDTANNLPVVRRGSLATPYIANYQGQPNFVVDIAAFGGSSGSPVLAVREYARINKAGLPIIIGDPELYLIGILHSGPTITAEGEIVQTPVPTSYVAKTNISIHLGYCVKADQLRGFIPVIRALIAAGSAPPRHQG